MRLRPPGIAPIRPDDLGVPPGSSVGGDGRQLVREEFDDR
jgi:hypothetical protein